jgi:hypothetical protein
MRVLGCFSFLFLLAAAGIAFVSEWSAMSAVAHFEDQRDFAAAEGALDRLVDAGTIFNRRPNLEARRELAYYGQLQPAVAAHDFSKAVRLINLIVENDVRSGVEGRARAIAAQLPDRHLEWLQELTREGRIAKAMDEALAARALYPGRADVHERARAVESDARVQIARQRLDDNDPVSALRELAGLDAAAPVRAQADALALAQRALSATADHYLGISDYPGLYRSLARARDVVQAHPVLVRQVDQFRLVQTARVFDVSLASLAVRGEHVPMTMQTVFALVPGEAALTIHNDDDRSIVSTLVGPERHKTVVPARGTRHVRPGAGEYVQLVHQPGAKDTRAYLGIVTVRNKVEQRYRIRPLVHDDGPTVQPS